ncbi:hypothetical protein TWF694_005349 [Orbilia ellipsospora]|uniref:F-box domain-containing protein n=1 Tax=Orbilia ellipsospora TaxID=2528407 RepID=A0AAV9WYX2_9PEZI
MDEYPVEILSHIYWFLPYKSLVNISLSSKHHRDIALPHLFRNLRISDASIEAFESGDYNHLIPYVRNVTFTKLRFGNEGLVKLISKAMQYVQFIERFPRITGVHIIYTVPGVCYWTLPLAILRAISVYSWYERLKSLSIEGLEQFRFPDRGHILNWIYGDRSETVAVRKFIDGLVSPAINDKLEFLWMSYPKRLESISINSLQSRRRYVYVFYDEAGFERTENAARKSKGWAKSDQTVILPALFLRNGHETLKNVHIKLGALRYRSGADGPDSPISPLPVYPLVTTLRMNFTVNFTSKDIKELATRFPMVEDLRLDIDTQVQLDYPDNDDAYRSYFTLFPNLKRSRTPWPLQSWLRQENYNLRLHVDDIAMQLAGLEYMEFVHTIRLESDFSTEPRYLEFIKFKTRDIGWDVWTEELPR